MLRIYLLVVGFAFVVCAGLAFKQAARRSRWVRAKGVVIGCVELAESDATSSKSFFPRIAFSTGDGRRFEFVSSVGGENEPPHGSSLGIRYDPDEPSHAVEDSFTAQWGFAIALLGLGVVSLLVAFLSPSI